MLRTTITKNRKAFILAFIPHILGGNIRHAPAKFQKLSVNVQRVLEKSTNSSSNNHDDICEKCRQLIEMSFGPNNETSNIKEQSFKKPETHDIFNPIQDIRKQQIGQNFIPNTDVRDESCCNRRSGIEEVNEGFNKQDEYRNENIINASSQDNTEIQYLTDEGKQVQNIEGGYKKSTPINNPNIDDIHERPKELQNANIELYVTNFEQKPSDNTIAETRQHKPNANEFEYGQYCNYPIINASMYINDKNNQSYTQSNITTVPLDNNSVKTTTAKENEEKLAQKLEHIDEIPIVEAPKENVEGFNVNPRVLSETDIKTEVYTYSDNTNNNSGAKEYNEASRLDELAKRCLNAPRNEIDDRLLKEMNKLGVPPTGHKITDTPLMKDELIQMDVLKKPKKPVGTTDIDLETSKYESNPEEYNDMRKLYPTYMSQSQSFQEGGQEHGITLNTTGYHLNQAENLGYTTEGEIQLEMERSVEEKPKFDPNRVLIDPYSKKITEEECDDYNNSDFTSKLQNSSITQATPLVHGNAVEHQKEFYNATVPYTTTEALEHKQHNLNPIPNSIQQEQTVNNSFPQNEQAATKDWWTVQQMGMEPHLQYCGQNPYPENQINYNTQEDYPQTTPGEQVSQSFEKPDQIVNSQLNEQTLKEAASAPTTLKESLVESSTCGQSEEKVHQADSTTVEESTMEPPLCRQIFTSNKKQVEYNDQINSKEKESDSSLKPEKIASSQINEKTLDVVVSTPTTLSEPPVEPPLCHQEQEKVPQINSNEQVSHSLVQPEQMANPLFTETPKEEANQNFTKNLTAALPITNLNLDRNVSLSELLRRVRYRNRMEYCSSFVVNSQAPEVDPVVGKCGTTKPPCPPPAPRCPAPPPPPPPCCPPPPPKCPKPCKPKCPAPCAPPKKGPCAKFKKNCLGNSVKGLLTLICTPSINHIKYAAMLFNFMIRSDKAAACPGYAVLTDDVVESLHSVGKILVSIQHDGRMETETTHIEEGSHGMSYARDYDPWTPIPSWPIEKKEEKKPFICPKEGCKQIPPPPRDAPCNEKPCAGFPKRIFSPMMDKKDGNEAYNCGEH